MGGKRYGYRVGKIENPIACYVAGYKIERVAALIRFITLKPFSYTHLDVYKRQCMDISVDGAGNAACPGKGDGEIVSVGLAAPAEGRTMPDVYKRQQ